MPAETFEERFDGLVGDVRGLGFDAIDLWCARLAPEWATDAHVAAASRVLNKHGMRVVSYAGGSFGATAVEFERLCAILRELNIRIIGGFCQIGEKVPSGLIQLLEKYDLFYHRETHAEKEPRQLLAWIAGFDSPRIGATIDTGWFASQGFDPAEAIRAIGDHLGYVHLKDVRAVGGHRTCAFGEGIVDIRSCVDALAEVGYAGTVSIEHEPETFDPSDGIRASKAQLEAMIAERG